MANVFDVAEYILSKMGPLTAMKLQKLVYYSQAWHLAWTRKRLFAEKIEAWRDGPVSPTLYEEHKGHFQLEVGLFKSRCSSGVRALSKDQKDVIERVMAHYGDKDPHWLSQLTHLEDPWKNARSGIEDDARSSAEIPTEAMLNYYSTL